MAIAVGEKIPNVKLFEMGEDGLSVFDSDELFAGKKIALFGVPGAFTSTCQNAHMPSYVVTAKALRAKGADDIVCVSVNDPFVMQAWAGVTGADKAGIRCVGDSNAELAKAMDLAIDRTAAGLGIRIDRFSAVVEDGVVKTLNLETTPRVVETTGGDVLLEQL